MVYDEAISRKEVLYMTSPFNMKVHDPWLSRIIYAGFVAVVVDVTEPHQAVLYTRTQIVTGAITNVNMRPLEQWSKKRNVAGFIAVVLDVTEPRKELMEQNIHPDEQENLKTKRN